MGVPISTWHVARDGFAEAVNFLALVTGSLGKIALDIMIMASTEFAEVYEPFVKGRGASSTMPQKRNPISSELMLAAAKAVRQHAGLMLDAQVQDFERATGPWHAEWIAIPESFVLTAGALHQAKFALGGLIVDDAQMAKNLDISRGLIVAEAVMMGLAPQLGRQEAHDVVYDACRRANEQHISLRDALSSDPQVTSRIDRCDDRTTDLAGQLSRPCAANGRPCAGFEAPRELTLNVLRTPPAQHAAVDDEFGAGDVARCIGREIKHAAWRCRVPDRHSPAASPVSRAPPGRSAHCPCYRQLRRDLAPDRGVDDAGMHRIDADAIAERLRIPSRPPSQTAARRPWWRSSRRGLCEPRRPASDDIMMMEPPPCLRISGRLYLTDRNTPSRLIAVCLRQSASDMSTMDGTAMPMPAFDTRMSSRPKRRSISATISAQRDSLVTSCSRKTALPPALVMRVTTSGPLSSSMSVATTVAPSCAEQFGDRLPYPRRAAGDQRDLACNLPCHFLLLTLS